MGGKRLSVTGGKQAGLFKFQLVKKGLFLHKKRHQAIQNVGEEGTAKCKGLR